MIQPEAKLLEAFPHAGPSLWTQETFFPKARGPGSRTKSVPLQPYIGAPAGRPRGCGARYPRERTRASGPERGQLCGSQGPLGQEQAGIWGQGGGGKKGETRREGILRRKSC